MSIATILTATFAVAAVLMVAAGAVIAIVAVENWAVRAAKRTALACDLDRHRQAAALEEITRHRARIDRDLDTLHQSTPEPEPVYLTASQQLTAPVPSPLTTGGEQR